MHGDGKNKQCETLLCKAECCAAQWRYRQPRLSDDHVVWVYSYTSDASWKGPWSCSFCYWSGKRWSVKPKWYWCQVWQVCFWCAEVETPSPWVGFSGCICIMFRSTFAFWCGCYLIPCWAGGISFKREWRPWWCWFLSLTVFLVTLWGSYLSTEGGSHWFGYAPCQWYCWLGWYLSFDGQ